VDHEPVSSKFPELAARTVHVNEGIAATSASPIEEKCAGLNDTLMYIFTSGTTGLPKPVPLKNSRSDALSCVSSPFNLQCHLFQVFDD
jgi:acyl-coenzyme A synthetase/AMP-(fatty) acid ligase